MATDSGLRIVRQYSDEARALSLRVSIFLISIIYHSQFYSQSTILGFAAKMFYESFHCILSKVHFLNCFN